MSHLSRKRSPMLGQADSCIPIEWTSFYQHLLALPSFDNTITGTLFKIIFSGSEWDYVIISLVRSLREDEFDPDPSLSWLREHLGFLTDEHQMNVGLTRARKGLCIIGKPDN